MAYLAALFLPPGVLMGFLGRTRRERLIFGVVYLLAVAVLLEATLVLAIGRAFDWGNVAVAAGVGAVVLTILGVTLYQPDLQRNPSHVPWAGVQSWS
jgi:peptidoglycan/LPS O-acetylase OafA/YrhL